MEVLEWPGVCRQVACFCGTSMAAEELLAARLPMGASQADSELLLQQTAEALELGLTVKGAYDLRPALAAAEAGGCLNAKQLDGVASTLEAAFEVKRAACAVAEEGGAAPSTSGHGSAAAAGGGASGGRTLAAGGGAVPWRAPTLAALAEGIAEEQRELLAAIRQCVSGGGVTDGASPALARVRSERRVNLRALREAVGAVARALVAKGASDSRDPTIVRGRFCVAVRANMRSALPKGSVKLGQSGTGNTLYIEPTPAVELNNLEALYADEEEAEEAKVMLRLSRALGARAAAVRSLLGAVAALDVAAARARHAAWLSGVRPRFVSRYAVGGEAAPLHLPGALHPLLLAPSLPPPPLPPSSEDAAFERNFQAPPSWALGAQGAAAASGVGAGAGAGAAGSKAPPQPLDLRVPPGRSVVAITGPNTGGKTVTLKTAGLMALMAKAGLYLPCRPDADAAAGAAAAAGGAVPSASLRWFDRVLADIGDAQSLQQSLSTFSGHVRRMRALLRCAGPLSLALLDEVGSGTDPAEGAALARALLDRLADQSGLVMATTHHAELRAAAEEDARYVNVSMEFDVATLRPTYRLCWGVAGASNALAIAEALGFDGAVLREARALLEEAAAAREAQARSVRTAEDMEAELERSRSALEAQRSARQEQEARLRALQAAVAELRRGRQRLQSAPRQLALERAQYLQELQAVMQGYRRGVASAQQVEAVFDRLQATLDRMGAVSAAQGGVTRGDRVRLPGRGAFSEHLTGTVERVDGQQLTVRVESAAPAPLGGSLSGMKARRVVVAASEVERLQEEGAVRQTPPPLPSV